MDSIITRRVDELGRIIIPKEIRKKLKIKYGDSMCFSLKEEKIIIQKKFEFNNIKIIKKVIDFISNIIDLKIAIVDFEKIIFSNNNEIKQNQVLEPFVIQILKSRKNKNFNNISIFGIKNCNVCIQPIILNGDTIGGIVLLKKDEISKIDLKIVEIIYSLFKNELEE